MVPSTLSVPRSDATSDRGAGPTPPELTVFCARGPSCVTHSPHHDCDEGLRPAQPRRSSARVAVTTGAVAPSACLRLQRCGQRPSSPARVLLAPSHKKRKGVSAETLGGGGVLLFAAGCCGLLRVAAGCCGLLRVAAGCCGLLRVAAGCWWQCPEVQVSGQVHMRKNGTTRQSGHLFNSGAHLNYQLRLFTRLLELQSTGVHETSSATRIRRIPAQKLLSSEVTPATVPCVPMRSTIET